MLHVPLYFEAIECLCPVLDIIDLFCELLTCSMTSSYVKNYAFISSVLQLAYVLNFYAYFPSFNYMFILWLYGPART